jgi:hypothetical protein
VKIADFDEAICHVPVYAVFDRPIIKIKERVIDIGDVFPTICYRTSLDISLLNPFPTEFRFRNYSRPVVAEDGTLFPEFATATPETGNLDLLQSKEIVITAQFCTLGDRALPFSCSVAGGSYTCALIANVLPPRLKLLTDTIDFSPDFVICKRSQAFVRIANECGVSSTVQLEMVDDAQGVFSLEDTDLKEVSDRAEFAVGCYSEIHGDYNGMLRLVIRDSWQFREVNIPLHVKALGSFFGFQKHTLGYVSSLGHDHISFGKDIPLGTDKVIRRLALANFSSEAITIEWSIANFVKGRQYATLDLTVADNGFINVNVDETPNANDQDPFRLLTDRTLVESHGKTVIVVEFLPTAPGTFMGCVAARSGEFIHTVGLLAVVPTQTQKVQH